MLILMSNTSCDNFLVIMCKNKFNNEKINFFFIKYFINKERLFFNAFQVSILPHRLSNQKSTFVPIQTNSQKVGLNTLKPFHLSVPCRLNGSLNALHGDKRNVKYDNMTR